MGGGRGQRRLVMSKEPEVSVIYFHSIPCRCSLFSLPKTLHSLTNVLAGLILIMSFGRPGKAAPMEDKNEKEWCHKLYNIF